MTGPNRNLRKVILLLVPLTIVIVGVVLVRACDGSDKPGGQDSSGVTTERTDPSAIPSELTDPTDPRGGNAPDSSVRQPQAVTRAATAVDSLAQALFFRSPGIMETVNEYVVPERRAVMRELSQKYGPLQARAWGYSSVADARQGALYYVSTLRYKVDNLDPNRATIRLFTITHFVAQPRTPIYCERANPCDYNDRNLIVVEMRKVGGKWLWFESRTPPEGDAPPPPISGKVTPTDNPVTVQEAMAAFEPFLEGFVNYETLQIETG